MFTNCVLSRCYDYRHLASVLTKAELLTELAAQVEGGKTKYARIGEALGLASSRVAEIFNAIRDTGGTQRELSYDEGVKLIRAFGLEPGSRVSPLPPAILRLAVRHVVRILEVEADEAQIEELAEDLRAFSEYASDPKVRRSIQAAEGFFQALQLRRPAHEEEARQETDLESGRGASR